MPSSPKPTRRIRLFTETVLAVAGTVLLVWLILKVEGHPTPRFFGLSTLLVVSVSAWLVVAWRSRSMDRELERFTDDIERGVENPSLPSFARDDETD